LSPPAPAGAGIELGRGDIQGFAKNAHPWLRSLPLIFPRRLKPSTITPTSTPTTTTTAERARRVTRRKRPRVTCNVNVTPIQISIFRIRSLVNADADENVNVDENVHVSRGRGRKRQRRRARVTSTWAFTSLLSIRQARRFFGGRPDCGPGRSAAQPWEDVVFTSMSPPVFWAGDRTG
jgi:hypothetical protein